MDIYHFIEKNISRIQNPVIFEIGSHIGMDSEKISRLTGSKIYGFEPDPRNLEILNGKRSQFFHEISPVAVSDSDGKANFYLSSGTPPEVYEDDDMNRDWSASNSLKFPRKHLDLHTWCKFDYFIEVDTIKLDTYCNAKGIERIDFVWMDVQGAEDLVIDGMQQMKLNTKFIYTEFSKEELYDKSPSKTQILKLLGSEWRIIKEFENDILLGNQSLNS